MPTKADEYPNAHPGEPHREGIVERLNWLRAGILGANDGIVSVAAVVVGVAGATADQGPIAAAGFAALVGGAISMALGEYVSVSSSRDTTRALIAKEQGELATTPEQELAELAGIYQAKGLTPETARQVAQELTAHDELAAHLEAELHIDATDIASPWGAAAASAFSFLIGGALPLLTILLLPVELKIPVTFMVVLLALAATGAIGALIGRSPVLRPTLRVVVGGVLALGATFAIGTLLGTTGVV